MAQTTRSATSDVPDSMPALNGVGAPGRRSGPIAYTISATTQVVNGLNKGMNVLEATQNVAKNFAVLMRDTATGLGAVITPAQAASLSVQIKKGGVTSYVTVTPVITVIGFTGLIDIAFTGLHLNTLGLMAVNVTGIGLLPNDDLFIDVVAVNKNDGVRGGLTALPNAAAGSTSGLPLKSDIPTAAAIRDAILDAARAGHVALGSIGEAIALSASLLQGNFYIDQTDNSSPNGQTAARLRCFSSGVAAAAATPGGSGEGEFATFLVTTTYTGPGKVDTHRVVQQ